MELSTFSSPPPPSARRSDDTSNAGPHFFSLPLEVRLLIYENLLVQSGGLPRTFCTCEHCAKLDPAIIGRECLNPSLLRTNRAILHEALPVLYARNVFCCFCYGRCTYVFGIMSSPRTLRKREDVIDLDAHHPHPRAGVGRVVNCPCDAAKSHVKRISLNMDQLFLQILEGYPRRWDFS